MKTNQNLIRKMGDFKVTQRTKDGMFNATGLLQQWNEFAGQDKRMNDFFDSKPTQEYLEALKSDADITASADNQIFTKVKGGSVQGTWMHPYLFIDFAMWLNPKFKLHVIKFVYDELIKNRNNSGDAYREMSSSIAKIVPATFMSQAMQKIAQAINYIIYGRHETEIRNTEADESKLHDLYEIERDITKLITGGFIRNFDSLIDYLRREYTIRRMPKALQ